MSSENMVIIRRYNDKIERFDVKNSLKKGWFELRMYPKVPQNTLKTPYFWRISPKKRGGMDFFGEKWRK